MSINEDSSLVELAAFTASMLDTLRGLGIATIGELLGATGGLQKLLSVEDEQLWRQAFAAVAGMLPAELIKKFTQPNPIPPMGLKMKESSDDNFS